MTVEQFCDACIDAQYATLVRLGAKLHELPNPATEQPPDNRPSVADTHEANAGSIKGQILVVDDHQAVRSMVHALLVSWNYAVTATTSAPEALAVLRARRTRAYDLLITDVEMPEMSGIELVSTVLDEQPDLRVLFVSGQADGTRERAAIDRRFPLETGAGRLAESAR